MNKITNIAMDDWNLDKIYAKSCSKIWHVFASSQLRSG